MLARLFFFGVAALVGLKLFAPQRFKRFGKQIDRGVNLTLVGLAIVYAVQAAIWFFSK
jgi:hypothetical protein